MNVNLPLSLSEPPNPPFPSKPRSLPPYKPLEDLRKKYNAYTLSIVTDRVMGGEVDKTENVPLRISLRGKMWAIANYLT